MRELPLYAGKRAVSNSIDTALLRFDSVFGVEVGVEPFFYLGFIVDGLATYLIIGNYIAIAEVLKGATVQ